MRTAAMSASERLRAGAANATSVSRRLTVGLEPGYWVFLCGAIVLLVAGYLRLVRGSAASPGI